MDDDQLVRADRGRKTIFGRKVWLALAVLSLTAVLFVVIDQPDPEPMFEGKPLSFHLGHLVKTASSKEYRSATNALTQAGTNALPVILLRIQRPAPWHVRLYFQQRTNMPRWMERRSREWLDPWTHHNRFLGAVRAVGLLGTNAAPIAAELVAELPRLENSNRTPLSGALVKIGPVVVEPIKPLLTSTNMRTRSLAAYVCYRLGTSSANAASDLVNGLLDGDPNHQRLVGQTLARMGQDVHPLVLELLSSTNQIKISAGMAAAEGPILQTSDTIAKILHQFENSDAGIRRSAALLISRRWPMNNDQFAEKRFENRNQNERINDYLKSFRMIQEHRPPWLKIMKEATDDPDAQRQLEIMSELVRHGFVDAELRAQADTLSKSDLIQPFNNRANYCLREIDTILTARAQTNSHPDTVQALKSAP